MAIGVLNTPYDFTQYLDMVREYVETKPFLQPLILNINQPTTYIDELKKRILHEWGNQLVDVEIFNGKAGCRFHVVVNLKKEVSMGERLNLTKDQDFSIYLDKVEDYLNTNEVDSLRLEVDKNLTFGTDLKSLILEKYKDRVQDVLIFLETIKHCMILLVIREVVTISTVELEKPETVRAEQHDPILDEAIRLSLRLLYSDNNNRTGAEIMGIVNDAYGRDVALKLRSMRTEDILRRLQNM